jgi:hypothetical protein
MQNKNASKIQSDKLRLIPNMVADINICCRVFCGIRELKSTTS